MPHPDAAKLIEHATHKSAGAAVDSHVRHCADCAGEVERWSHVAAAYAWRDSEAIDQGCLDELAIAALADGSMQRSAREIAVVHLASCARCRSAVASVSRALVSTDVRDAIAQLDQAPRRGLLRVFVPLAAVAALILMLVPDPQQVGPEPHRAPASLTAPMTIAPNGATSSVQVLRWHAVGGADRYRVTLFDGDGVVLWERALPDTVVGLPSDVSLLPGRSYYWLVAARTGFDRWDASALIEFSVTAADN